MKQSTFGVSGPKVKVTGGRIVRCGGLAEDHSDPLGSSSFSSWLLQVSLTFGPVSVCLPANTTRTRCSI